MSSKKFNPTIILDRDTAVPLFTQIATQFRSEIIKNRLASGTRIVSERYLAKKLEINRNTVHQAYLQLSDEGLLSENNGRGEMLIAAKALEQYRMPFPMINLNLPFRLSDQFKNRNSKIGDFLGGVTDYAAEMRISVNFLVMPPPDSPVAEIEKWLESFTSHSIGVISFGLRSIAFDPVFEALVNIKTLPHVFISGRSKYSHISDVTVDFKPGFKQMLECLWELGHRKLGIIASFRYSNDQFMNCGYERGAILEQLAIEYGFEVIKEEITDFKSSIPRMFDGDKTPDVLWVQNDDLALQVIKELQKLKIRVPEDVSVIGYDNASPDSDLSTLQHSRYEIGREAIKAAVDLFNNRRPGDATRIQVKNSFIKGKTIVSRKKTKRTGEKNEETKKM